MITLRNIVEEDLNRIMEWRMRPDITRYMNTDPRLTLEGQKRWLKQIKNDKSVRYWMIVIDGCDAGVLNLTDLDINEGETFWGYYIGEKSKRSFDNAINIELNLYKYCFETLGLKIVKGEVFSENKATIKLHKICGCKVEEEKKDYIEKNGTFYDVTFLSIDNIKWEQIKNRIPFENINFINEEK